MLISELFKDQNIIVNLESENKEKLFIELVDYLIKNERDYNRDEILEGMWDREKKMTTGIAPHIAIPHAHLKSLKSTIGILGISKKGIEYESLDGLPVHVVMLILGDKNKPEEHLNILKNIAKLLTHKDFYSNLMKAESSKEIVAVIMEFEKNK